MSWLFPSPVKNNSITPSQVQQYMLPVQNTIGQMQGAYDESVSLSRNLMDPMSAHNQNQRRLQQEQGANSLALQNLLARREAAATGQDSQFTSSQRMMNSRQMGRDLNQQYQLGLQRNYAQGIGQFNQSQSMLNPIMAGQLGVQENIAQSDIAARKSEMDAQIANRQMNQQTASGLLGSILSIFGQGS